MKTLSKKREELFRRIQDGNFCMGKIVDGIEDQDKEFVRERWGDLFNLLNYINISVYKRPISEETNTFVNAFRGEVKKAIEKLKKEAGEELLSNTPKTDKTKLCAECGNIKSWCDCDEFKPSQSKGDKKE